MNPSLAVARERLMAWATRGPMLEQLQAAKKEFFEPTGEVRADEPTFDAWMDAFADWYLCDRRLPQGLTPAEAYLASEECTSLSEEERASFMAFTRTRWSLFMLLKREEGALRVLDLGSLEKQRVVERRRMVGLNRGDIFEARLIPRDGGEWRFTGMPLFHPPQVRRMVLRVVAHARKAGPTQFGEAARALGVRRLRVDRYRKVPPRSLYQDLLPKRHWLFFWR